LIRHAVVDQVRGEHVVPVGAQYVDDRAAAGRRLPYLARERLHAQQRLDGNGRRLVEVVPALVMRVPLHLAGMV
jgi:hypothetical protein